MNCNLIRLFWEHSNLFINNSNKQTKNNTAVFSCAGSPTLFLQKTSKQSVLSRPVNRIIAIFKNILLSRPVCTELRLSFHCRIAPSLSPAHWKRFVVGSTKCGWLTLENSVLVRRFDRVCCRIYWSRRQQWTFRLVIR